MDTIGAISLPEPLAKSEKSFLQGRLLQLVATLQLSLNEYADGNDIQGLFFCWLDMGKVFDRVEHILFL